MTSRRATERDLIPLCSLFGEYLTYHRESARKAGHDDALDPDSQQMMGGAMEYMVAKVATQNQGNIVLVNEDESGCIQGFMVGCITYPGKMWRHKCVAEIEFLYPFSFQSSPMKEHFHQVAQSMGATAVRCNVTPYQRAQIEIYEKREHMSMCSHFMFKEYEEG